MKRVLVVDDEADMLWMLQRNLNKGMDDVEILAAESGEEALAILSDKDVNLVISDINMPGMNGLDLLTEVSNRYPSTGVIIMTAYPSNTYENQAMLSGSLRFIEKPFDIKDMRNIVQETLKAEEGFQGTVDGVDLMDIVQFNGLSRATAALKVTTDDKEGMIFFKDGSVVHAMCDAQTGESAFFKILAFQGGSLQNIRGVEPPLVTITQGLESLLLEAVRLTDEGGDEGMSATDGQEETQDINFDFLESSETIAEPDIELSQAEDLLENGGEESLIAVPSNSDIEEIEMTQVQAILAEFTNIEGVHSACLVGRDGFLLDSLTRVGIDAEMIGAIASSGFGSAESMGNQLGQGELNMTMFEYANGPVMFAPVGTEAFLVIIADQDTNLGWIRMTIKKNSMKIEEAANF